MLLFESTDVMAVLVSALLAVAIEYVWYSTIFFGGLWERLANVREDDEPLSVFIRETALKIIFFVFTFSLLGTYVVTRSSFTDFLFTSLAVVFAVSIALVLVSMREKRGLGYAFVHVGYSVLALMCGMTIIGYWPW